MGPASCHRGGVSPFLVQEQATSYVPLTVALVLWPLIWVAYTTGVPEWRRVLALGVPTVGLAIGHTPADRFVIVPALCLLAAWPITRVSAAYLAATVVGSVVVAVGSACNHAVVIAADGAALAVAIVFVLQGPHPELPVLGAITEASLLALVLVTSPGLLGDRESHMTWWGLAALAVFDYARARGSADAVFITVLSLQMCVVIGVWYMSATRCDLLADAQREVGDTAYFVGNAAMHYWPSFRILLYRPKSLVHPARQAISAIGAIAIYVANTNPTKVYGCQSWLTEPVILGTFTLVVLTVAGIGAVCGTYVYPITTK